MFGSDKAAVKSLVENFDHRGRCALRCTDAIEHARLIAWYCFGMKRRNPPNQSNRWNELSGKIDSFPDLSMQRDHITYSIDTPESRHVECKRLCPLWAKSGHRWDPMAPTEVAETVS